MFGSNLKRLREKKGLSQQTLAEEMNVVRQTVSKWENGRSSPSADQLEHLATVLEVTIEQLFKTNEGIVRVRSSSAGRVMIKTIIERLERMNEEGVEAMFNLFQIIPEKERWLASTSPERIAELDAIQAQREQQEKAEKEQAAESAEVMRKEIYRECASMFNAIQNIHVPTRYDLCVKEIRAIDFVCGSVSRCFPEYAYSVAGKYFDYGFVKGIRYAKAQAKKKQMC